MKPNTQSGFRFQDLPRDYEGLCLVHLPRPIHDATDYANLAEVADDMALWQDEFTPDQRDYFEMLCSLMESYDGRHVKWPKLDGPAMLKHLMGEHGLKAADLSRILEGSRNLGAMILRGERHLTLAHIRKLAVHFGVNPGLFV